MLIFIFSASAYGAEINININSVDVIFTESTGNPYVDENYRTQVPLRVTMEQAGAEVTWDSESYTAIIEKRGTVVKVPIGLKYIDVDGKQIPTDTAAVIIDGKTYLPIRPVLEAVDFNVSWDNELQTVFASNYYDFLENEEIVLSEKRKDISTAEDLLEYIVSSYNLEKGKELAYELAERKYLDKLNEGYGELKIISYFEWYNKEQLKDDGIMLDDSLFLINCDEDFNYTYSGKIVLNGKNKTATINVPNHVVNYPGNGGEFENRECMYDGITIRFIYSKLEFKGEDLVALGLFE